MSAVKELVSNAAKTDKSVVQLNVSSKGKETKKNPERHPRPRLGKTAKDRANGAKNTNLENKDARASWQNDTKRPAFPAHTCNGKRNRYQVTGKGNQTVYLVDVKKK